MRVRMDAQLRPFLTFDCAGYLAFLREQGVEQSKSDQLNVCLLLQFGADFICAGEYWSLTNCVYIPTWHEVEIDQLNRTLLHETHHFLQQCQGRDFDAEFCFPYRDRPHEREARAFAEEHLQHSAFLLTHGHRTLLVTSRVRDWWMGRSCP